MHRTRNTAPDLDGIEPVLRKMLALGLAEPDVDQHPRAWRLTPLAQRRLDSLAGPELPPEQLIYFGHRCATCQERRPTRYRQGAFVCDACARIGISDDRDRADVVSLAKQDDRHEQSA